ncbi:hypothetical protein [Pseudomonas sp. ENNP23]|uniref:hypothetical protein n=1 Tax=Pseudomonas sp. ENNP23 TaxID=1535636 RepID=UPI00084ACF10|nr:hypothetical protein [Pseudomonas sp. ENNP23]OEC59480.1 hypothetical protein A9G05_11235 [Pseudomonas sp. ENNP23]
MRERPILFAGPMVRAIHSGEKTVTRRIVKPQYNEGPWSVRTAETPRHERHTHDWWLPDGTRPYAALPHCPYGQPGDRLWVREGFWQAGEWTSAYPEGDCDHWVGSKRIHFRADGEPPNEPNRHYPNGLRNGSYAAADPHRVWRARPSIHMPRWASRILLEIIAVRVERLQDISDEQALAEGVDQTNTSIPGYARQRFHDLWESINGAESWAANPWVWVVEFRRIAA